MPDTRKIAVLGAGMVGVSAAVHLLRRGFDVTLIDRRAAGEETSYGNAGAIEHGSYTPVAFPRDPRELLAYALGRKSALNYDPAFLPKIGGWLARLWRESSRERMIANAANFRPIVSQAADEHKKLAKDAKVPHLIRDAGWLVLYGSEEEFRTDRLDRDIATIQGVGFDELTVDEALELEPHLSRSFARAVFWPNVAHTANPGALTKAYAKLFAEEGGTFRQSEVRGLDRRVDGWRIRLADGDLDVAEVVVALGPWSMDILSPLGLSFPFAVKRGYHQHFKPAGNATLSRPVLNNFNGFVLAPMEQGIRVTTGIEFADRDAPKTPVQLGKVLPMARDLFPLAEAMEDEPWMGRRPSFPDSRPIIGPAPGHQGLWLDFGHAHLGLTLGAASGRLMADMVAGDEPFVDPTPFAASRF